MISKLDFGYDVHCDNCTNNETFDVVEFSDLIIEMKRAMWKNVKNKDKWRNICPACSES